MTAVPRRSDEDDEEVVPRPAALIESLRSFGYTPAAAVADLIDNSITAGATTVGVGFEWRGSDSYVTIVDDGSGMDEVTLRDAMRAGSSSPLDSRSAGDLGRFGLGLKTASFSQARALTVASRHAPSGSASVRRWDLDHVGRQNRWSLLKTAPDQLASEVDRLIPAEHGTLVVWSSLDRLVDDRPSDDVKAQRAFFGMVDRVREHLEMVFHRYLSRGDLAIYVNGQRCEPWDPFLSSHRATERLASEDRKVTTPSGTVQTLGIQPFVLPHRSALSKPEHAAAAGPRGWNLQQGFYLYRADRLIVAGDWFDPGTKPEEHHKLARIRVDITQEMDNDWALDVRKSKARPPARFREDFKRIARATRERAQDVYRHHGRRSVGQGHRKALSPVWLVEQAGGRFTYRVNRAHRLVRFVLDEAPARDRSRIRALLSLIESNVPVANILSQGFSDESRLDPPAPELTPELEQSLVELFGKLRSDGIPADEAREFLRSQQPLEAFAAFIDSLEVTDS